MAQVADDTVVAKRILDHVAAGTTDAGEEVWCEPVRNYLDPDRFAAEVALIRTRPVVFCPSAALAEPGAYLARDVAGTPVVALRGRDGRVWAFRNACRHRGMQLVEGAGCARSLVCGYHGWTYGLDGELRHVPHADGFAGLDPADRGLVALPAVERHGLVFVAQAGQAHPGPDAEVVEGVIDDDLAYLGTAEHEEPTNWKIQTETFLEGLHIRFAHRTTFFPLQYDNLNLVETVGENSRVTFPFRNIERLAAVPAAERRVDGRVTFVHHLFPNAVVVTFPAQVLVFVIEPRAVDRTTFVSFALGRPPGAPGVPSPGRGGGTDLLALGGAEDFAAARAVQRGLHSGANDHLTFGRHESAIAHFHRHLDAALGAVR